jgi:hypothetical protein
MSSSTDPETNIVDEFTVYSMGMCHASVCTSLSLPKATKRLNMESPTGLDNGWDKKDAPFAGGESNPSQCPDHPETHKHYLFVC